MLVRFVTATAIAAVILALTALALPPHHPIAWAMTGMLFSILVGFIVWQIWRR